MAVRIYSLAKQLNIESKEILELCAQAGIRDKTSTLAGLSDDEVARIRQVHAERSAVVSKKEPVPERPVVGIGAKMPGKVRSLDTRTAAPPVPTKTAAAPLQVAATPDAPAPVAVKPSVPVSVVAPVATTEVASPAVLIPAVSPTATKPAEPSSPPETAPPSETVSPAEPAATKKRSPLGGFIGKKEETPSTPPSVPLPPSSTGLSDREYMAAMQRSGYRGPMRVITDKIPSLDGGGRKSDKATPTEKSTGKSPAIHLAPLPRGKGAKPAVRPAGPAPQKPDMKLPAEAIRAVKDGTTTVEKHIQETEASRAAAVRTAADKKAGIGIDKPRKTVADTEAEAEELAARQLLARRQQKDAGTGKRRRGTSRRRNDDQDQEVVAPKQLKRIKHRGVASSTAAPRKSDIVLQLPCTVKQFSEMTGLSLAAVMKKLLELGIPKSLNSVLDDEAAHLLVEAFSLRVEVRAEVTLEDQIIASLFDPYDPPELLQPRPPVVTFLGHVDHGKTSLLDKILHLDVVSGEKGGITQHIRAYRVTTAKGDVAFVDTPGHEAFTEMRARGANCTDIAVVVVAADDGVMPQTEEAISHARAAGVPIVVALNKVDLPGINLDRVMQELATNDLLPSEWGGDVEVVKCSALTGEGIDHLLEMLLTIAELHNLTANPSRPAIGLALEAEMQAGQGVVTKVLVRNGTLRTGDVLLCGTAYGRVKAMYDTLDSSKQISEATPGTPVNLVGLDVAPSAGSPFCVVDDLSAARRIAEIRAKESRKTELAGNAPRVTLENLFSRIDGSVSTLNIIIRADVRGSIEAIKKELGKLDHPEVQIRILQATVGGITEADVQLADASDAIIVGFNVVPDEKARSLADSRKIQIRRYDIIYKLTDDIRAALEGMLKPVEQVKELGRALVQRIFSISRLGNIAGCRVLAGTIERDGKARVIRESRIIGEYNIDSLKREKDDAKDVREGYECGIKLKGFNDLKEGDVLEVYKIEEIARTF
ncbi:MAG: translation initiation factor IF-2 [Thermoguttaceae bacterium]